MEACGPSRGLPGAMPCENVHWPSTSPTHCCDMLSVNPTATPPVGPLAVQPPVNHVWSRFWQFLCTSLVCTLLCLPLCFPFGHCNPFPAHTFRLVVAVGSAPLYQYIVLDPLFLPVFVPGPFQSVGEISYHWKPIQTLPASAVSHKQLLL